MSSKSCAAVWCLWFGAVAAFTGMAESQQNLQKLHGHVVPVISSGQIRSLSALPSQKRMHFSVILPLRNEAQLDELLADLYNPGSPAYHRFLSVEEFTERFAPTEQDYQSVVDYAVANGFAVDQRPANRMVVGLSGSVDQVERALHVRMNVYQHPKEERTFFSPDREPSLQLSVPILRVAGLDDFNLPKPMVLKGNAATATPLASTAHGSGPLRGALFVQVLPAYLFDMDVTPSPILLTAGGSGAGNLTITPHGSFSQYVNLAVTSGLPDGVSASFSPASTQTSSHASAPWRQASQRMATAKRAACRVRYYCVRTERVRWLGFGESFGAAFYADANGTCCAGPRAATEPDQHSHRLGGFTIRHHAHGPGHTHGRLNTAGLPVPLEAPSAC